MKQLSLKFDHVHIYVQDVDKAANWFVDMFDVEIIKSSVRTTADLGGMQLFFQQAEKLDDMISVPAAKRLGYNHIGLAVIDIDQLAATLKSRGARFTIEPVTVRQGVRMFFVEGPDGLLVECLERNERYV